MLCFGIRDAATGLASIAIFQPAVRQVNRARHMSLRKPFRTAYIQQNESGVIQNP
jgi:hypothetical protein